jgi:DNA-binding transcriptional LysR family regulator
MNYTLHQLQVFLEVVQQESITKAAEELHLTQPAVSIQLKNFQRQFDIPLTEIIGKQLFVTDFGRSIADIAENVLMEADAIKHKTKEFKGILAGKLRISSASTGKYVMPSFLSGFMKQYKSVDLALDVTNKRSVIRSLKKNEIDFALISVLPNDIEVQEERLLDNMLFLVGNDLKFKRDKPLIYREEGSATRNAMDQYFKKLKEHKSIELTSNEAVKQAVLAGLGYSIIPLIGIKNELSNKELNIIPSEGLPIVSSWRLVWLKEKKLSPLAEAYLQYVRKEKEEIIKSSFQWYLDYGNNLKIGK